MTQAEGPVRTRCFCPGTPHEHDEYHLADGEHLPIEAGLAAAMALANAGGVDGLASSELIAAVLRHGAILRWNLVDGEGDPVPITPRTVADRLTWQKGGVELAGAALKRYVTDAGAPFGSSTSPSPNGTSSPDGQTEPPTLATTPSSSTRRRRSASSSPASSDGPPSPDPTP